ncbi:LysR family transcriptional regulator [Flaviflagellibacter deserti]|jgi:DNA-binding transcriptional LysR family regulator|uniref:LysR family transcriptional regulator n=1 Tax=Flaviflagellibacter deserti TaxID=2267266 RepID=A0ABV9Z2B0_9HYPH
MDIDQLRTFDRIVRDGSFTKAAARLNVTQATVSMRVKSLEDALGGALLQRGRKITLTERGITFLPYARRVLAALLEGEDALRAVERGRLTVASLRSLVTCFTGPVVAEFAAAHPGVEFDFEEGRHRDIAEWLHDRALDLAVMGWPNLNPLLETLTPLAIFRERALLVASPAIAKRIGPEPTLDRVFEIAPQFLTFFWWQVTPEPIVELRFRAKASSQMLFRPGLQLIEKGAAVGHLMEPTIREELESGRLVDLAPVDMPSINRDTALVAGGDISGRPLIEGLADAFVAGAAERGLLHRDLRPSR